MGPTVLPRVCLEIGEDAEVVHTYPAGRARVAPEVADPPVAPPTYDPPPTRLDPDMTGSRWA